MPRHFLRYFLWLLVTSPVIGVNVLHARVLQEGDDQTSSVLSARSIAVSAIGQLWVDGIVPYTIDSDLSANSLNAINSAIEHWNTVGGISLQPLSQVQRETGVTVKDSVRFIVGDYCASWVGRRGGQQDLWVAPNCPAGSVMHEIGHLLGLEHEHTRPDRDQYIKINWGNIEPDKRHNFDTAPPASRLPGAYDVDSIMHYGSHNFSSNGKPTITLLDGAVSGIGQRRAPSEGDLNAVAELYGSDLSLVARSDGANLDIYISNETLTGAHDVTLDVNLGQDGVLVDPTSDRWFCANVETGRMLCTSYVLPGGAVEHLSLKLPDEQETADIRVSVTSKTHDNDLSNNTNGVASDVAGEPPSRQPAQILAAASSHKTLFRDDAVAHVSQGAGAMDVTGIVGLLLLLVGQACGRVDKRRTVVGEHRR